MTTPPSDNQAPAPVCGQRHPTAPVSCTHPPGHEQQMSHAGHDSDGQLFEWE